MSAPSDPAAGAAAQGSPAPEEGPPLIHAEGVTAHRGGKVILDRVSLSIRRGAAFALVGTSGSGKTTLLFCAAGLLPVSAGSIAIAGQAVSELAPRQRAARLGLVFQDYQLFPHLSALDNVCLAPRLHAEGKAGGAAPEEKARALLGELGIGDLHARFPHELSGGQKQRVAIARSLILEPDVLFLDEPSAALDERTTEELSALLARLNERSQIVVVSHDRPFVEGFCPRGARMAEGRVVAEGDIASVF